MEKRIDYRIYHFHWKDWGEYALKMVIKGIMICYLFYDSWKAVILLLPLGVIDYKSMKKQKLEKQQRVLTLQFKNMIEALATALSAGYSLEKGFLETRRDLKFIYPENAMIFSEINLILEGLKMNRPVEQLVKDFGERSGIDDIMNFSNVVMVAKKSGGNLVRIIQKTARSITDKIATEEEIETMITAKKYEEKVMMIMPYGIILYLRLTNGDFFQVLYHNLLGAVLMTIFLVVIYIADLWARRIMDIQV